MSSCYATVFLCGTQRGQGGISLRVVGIAYGPCIASGPCRNVVLRGALTGVPMDGRHVSSSGAKQAW